MKRYEKLVELRKSSGLSQDELAERLDVSRQSISRWETGQAEPSLESLRAMCALYQVSADYLLMDDAVLPGETDSPEEYRMLRRHRARRVLWVALAVVLAAALAVFAWWYWEEGRWPEVHTEKIDMSEVNWNSSAFYWS